MTYLVAFILLAVFLAFATLMFLEKLSALLALPLMALAFLVVGLIADLCQPLHDGGPAEQARSGQQSRLAQWAQTRRECLMRVGDRRALYRELLTRAEEAAAAPAPELAERVAALCAEIAERDAAIGAAFEHAFAPLAERLPRPGQLDAQRARCRAEFDAFAVRAAGRRLLAAAREPEERRAAAVREVAADALRAVPDAPRVENLGLDDFVRSEAPRYVWDHVSYVLRNGAMALHVAIIATIFGGMFALYVRNLKIAERLVYWTAEFAGERPRVVTLAVFVVTALIFTSVGGLGTVIMLGAIILPVLRSIGLSPIVGSGVFLIAIAMGGTLMPVSRRLWLEFYGLTPAQLDPILWTMVGFYAACGLAWIFWGTRRRMMSSFHAEPDDETKPGAPAVVREAVSAWLMAAPVLPVVLVYFLGVEDIPAFLAAIAYMFACVCRRPDAVRVLARSLIEGAQAVMPPVLLMLGIGILITAISVAPVQSYLRPLLVAAVPESRIGYVAVFALAAPLALYRGPLNVWGMGLAVSAILLASGALPPAAILGAILAAGMLQGVCDPTNTANVWIAGFQGVTANQILRFTLIPVWLAAAGAVVVFGWRLV